MSVRCTPQRRFAALLTAASLTACGAVEPELGTRDAELTALLAEPTGVGQHEPLAVLAGRYGPAHRGLYGTDLGWSFKHGNKLWLLFGDSWATPTQYFIGTPITPSDDALGFVPLDTLPDGDAVEARVKTNARWTTDTWRAAPSIMQVAPRTGAQPIQLWGGGWYAMGMGPGLTPMAGFSNARSDSRAGAFGIFFRYAHRTCVSNACSNGWACDSGLGRCVREGASAPDPLSMACVFQDVQQNPRPDCVRCAPVGGICQDRSSSMYDLSAQGRVSSAVLTHEVGAALDSNNLTADPKLQFDTRPWDTHRFFNATARTVNDFDAARLGGTGNDYRSADGVNPAREGVFVWGRPHFGGLSREGRDAQLYLAWVPMPQYSPNGAFSWTPQYFAGLDAQGRPRFVAREVDSVALNLSHASAEPSKEKLDVVGQMSIAWIPNFNRWVMIYGGGLSEQFGELIFGPDWPNVNWDLVGPLYVRSAPHPWGPWSDAKPLLVPGNAASATGLYAEGKLLYSPACSGTGCVQSEVAWSNPGGLYGPNIIEPWTEVRQGAVDLYWNLSTWNPYEVVLMKSRLTAADVQ